MGASYSSDGWVLGGLSVLGEGEGGGDEVWSLLIGGGLLFMKTRSVCRRTRRHAHRMEHVAFISISALGCSGYSESSPVDQRKLH